MSYNTNKSWFVIKQSNLWRHRAPSGRVHQSLADRCHSAPLTAVSTAPYSFSMRHQSPFPFISLSMSYHRQAGLRRIHFHVFLALTLFFPQVRSFHPFRPFSTHFVLSIFTPTINRPFPTFFAHNRKIVRFYFILIISLSYDSNLIRSDAHKWKCNK